MLPLVSIIIPVYNREEIIHETIDAALNQTYPNVEVIVGDNCSVDNTFEKISSLYDRNSRIQIVRNNCNIGPVNNWKRCVELAKGKYLKILFSDDLINMTFIEEAVALLEKYEEAAFVFSSVRFFERLPDPEINVIGNELYTGYNHKIRLMGGMKIHKTVTAYKFGRTGYYNRDIFIDRCFELRVFKDCPVSPSCALFRRDAVSITTELDDNKFEFPYMETGAGIDQRIFLDSLDEYKGFCYINKPLCYFRFHIDSITVKEKNLVRGYDIARSLYLQNCREQKKQYQRYRNNDIMLVGGSKLSVRELMIPRVFNNYIKLYYNTIFEYKGFMLWNTLVRVVSRRMQMRIWNNRIVQRFRLFEIEKREGNE